jgi:hypothetical protein
MSAPSTNINILPILTGTQVRTSLLPPTPSPGLDIVGYSSRYKDHHAMLVLFKGGDKKAPPGDI